MAEPLIVVANYTRFLINYLYSGLAGKEMLDFTVSV